MDEPGDWVGDGWSSARERSFTRGLKASPTERLAWLEEMIRLAWASGALPHRRAENGDRIPRGSLPPSIALRADSK